MARPTAIAEGAKRSREMIRQMAEETQAEKDKTKAAIRQDLGIAMTGDESPNGAAQTEPPAGQGGEPQTQGQAEPPDTSSEPRNQGQQQSNNDDSLQNRIRDLENENARLAQANTVLRGKYESEVPRMAEEIRQLKDQIKRQEAPPSGDVQEIKNALLDMYSADEVDQIEKLIRIIAAENKPAQTSDADDLRRDLQQTQAQLREQQLTTLVPDWKKIQQNESAAWIRFLQHRDAISGRERNDFLQEAWGQGDIERVAEIFNLYKRERDAAKPRGQEPPTVPDDNGSRTHVDAAQQGKTVYKRSYIAQVEAMARNGDFRGREQELSELRRKFRIAAAEGRVDPKS